MFDFEGTTTIGRAQAPTSGDIWLRNTGEVDGMALWATRPEFASEKLAIATLDTAGHLGPDVSAAYPFLNPSEKMNHAADFMCTVTSGS